MVKYQIKFYENANKKGEFVEELWIAKNRAHLLERLSNSAYFNAGWVPCIEGIK